MERKTSYLLRGVYLYFINIKLIGLLKIPKSIILPIRFYLLSEFMEKK